MRLKMAYDSFDQDSLDTGLECKDDSLAIQSALEESDINTIVRRFGLTGQLPSEVRAPQYGDFTEVTDYQTALNAVIAANDAFAQMPADVRARFDNDPGKFVDFCSDEANREEAKKLGLLVPDKEPVEPISVRVIPDDPVPTP